MIEEYEKEFPAIMLGVCMMLALMMLILSGMGIIK